LELLTRTQSQNEECRETYRGKEVTFTESIRTGYWGQYLEKPKFSPMSNMCGCYTGTEVKILPVP